MLRASASAERSGIPTSSLVCEGFLGQAAETVLGIGMPNLPCAKVPGHPNVQSNEELRTNIMGVTLDGVIQSLTGTIPPIELPRAEHTPREIVFSGSFEDVNEHFYEREWSEGLPVVPPTVEKIEAFLRYTDLPPEHTIGVLLPDSRAATVWSVATNGVMAGCRPEYMPILVAIVEALADPMYGVEHSGNTPGAETLIVLNGPIITELGFNYRQGAMRDGFQPNTSIGRFLRLFTRNVVGFLPHKTDKATFGNTWHVVVAENEFVLGRIKWEPLCTDVGIPAGENAVSIARYTGGEVVASITGDTPELLLPVLADALLTQQRWELIFTAGLAFGMLRPLVLMSPIIAQTIARAGWSRDDVKQYFFDHCRLPAWKFERYVAKFTGQFFPGRSSLADMVKRGEIPPVFYESNDSARMVPIVFEPKAFMIGVTGDPGRTNAYVFSHNGRLGYTVGRQIRLPKDWADLPKKRG